MACRKMKAQKKAGNLLAPICQTIQYRAAVFIDLIYAVSLFWKQEAFELYFTFTRLK